MRLRSFAFTITCCFIALMLYLSTTRDQIPHILHQSWKSKTIPASFNGWPATWSTFHPAWKYIIWTDDENRQLVVEHYPWFLATYDGFDKNIKRIDAVRYMYMHKFGGVYADLDFECVGKMDAVLKNKRVVLGRMGNDALFEHSIPNAWMASVPGHSFWIDILRDIQASVSKERDYKITAAVWEKMKTPEEMTGPVRLFRSYQAKKKARHTDISVLSGEYVYPFNWDDHAKRDVCLAFSPNFDSGACKKIALAANSFCITYWSHSWESKNKDVKF